MRACRPTITALLCALALAAACDMGSVELAFEHHESRKAALADAKTRGVPLLIDFHADW